MYYIPSSETNSTQEAVGNLVINAYFYGVASDTANKLRLPDGSNATTRNITDVERNLIFGNGTNIFAYWIDSRGMMADDADVYWGQGCVKERYCYSRTAARTSLGSKDTSSFIPCKIRPMIITEGETPEVID